MKKIGILFGQENSFPQAFVERVNQKAEKNISAEFVRIDKVMQAEPLDYAVIIDRISQDVPFYRATLKNAAICGTAVINNPFWWSADEKFFNNALAVKIGVPVPKTVILPSKDLPDDTTDRSFRNMAYPLDWEGIFNYVGFPAYMKPFDGGGWKEVYQITSMEDLWPKYDQTKQYVMMLQEEIKFDDYFRCYCIGGKHVRIMQYEPRNPHHLRYEHGKAPAAKKLLETVKDYVIKLNKYLGYDFNTVEFAIRDGIPYAIDFCNPAPDAEVTSVGQDNFEWVVETAADYAIERAKKQKDNHDNLTWGEFLKTSAAGTSLLSHEKKIEKKADKKEATAGVIDHPVTAEGEVRTVKKAVVKKTAVKKTIKK
jgi:glutathione synthase/RimK-type ligase-like ATP-grasp enzyme